MITVRSFGDLPGHPFRGNQWTKKGISVTGAQFTKVLNKLPSSHAFRKLISPGVSAEEIAERSYIWAGKIPEFDGQPAVNTSIIFTNFGIKGAEYGGFGRHIGVVRADRILGLGDKQRVFLTMVTGRPLSGAVKGEGSPNRLNRNLDAFDRARLKLHMDQNGTVLWVENKSPQMRENQVSSLQEAKTLLKRFANLRG